MQAFKAVLLRTFTFIEASASQIDSLDFHVAVHVVEAVDEEAAWKQVLYGDADPEDYEEDEYEEDDDPFEVPARGVVWDKDHDRVKLLQIVPREVGWHSLAHESNG